MFETIYLKKIICYQVLRSFWATQTTVSLPALSYTSIWEDLKVLSYCRRRVSFVTSIYPSIQALSGRILSNYFLFFLKKSAKDVPVIRRAIFVWALNMKTMFAAHVSAAKNLKFTGLSRVRSNSTKWNEKAHNPHKLILAQVLFHLYLFDLVLSPGIYYRTNAKTNWIYAQDIA